MGQSGEEKRGASQTHMEEVGKQGRQYADGVSESRNSTQMNRNGLKVLKS